MWGIIPQLFLCLIQTKFSKWLLSSQIRQKSLSATLRRKKEKRDALALQCHGLEPSYLWTKSGESIYFHLFAALLMRWICAKTKNVGFFYEFGSSTASLQPVRMEVVGWGGEITEWIFWLIIIFTDRMSGSVLEVNTDLFAIFINVAQFYLMTEFVLMIF